MLAIAAVSGCAGADGGSTPATTSPAAESPRPSVTPSATPPPMPRFDRNARSIDDPASIWVVVNKLRPLDPVEYAPADLERVDVAHTNEPWLRREAAEALVRLFDAARVDGRLELQSLSAYRSYTTQVGVYGEIVSRQGQAQADTISARPGHSEHQTGLAVDIGSVPSRCAFEACFGETEHGIWLAENAWRFGFVLRYPADKTAITGYSYEPWHFRYVGTDLAAEMHDDDVRTLEEFFGLPAAPDYPD